MPIRNCVAVLLILFSVTAGSEIYRCKSPEGELLYTDNQCDGGMGQKVELLPIVTVKKAKPSLLNKTELDALKKLDRKIAESRKLRTKRRQQKYKQVLKRNDIKRQNCRLANSQIAKVLYKKSHGYALSEAGELDQKVRDLEMIKRVNCD